MDKKREASRDETRLDFSLSLNLSLALFHEEGPLGEQAKESLYSPHMNQALLLLLHTKQILA